MILNLAGLLTGALLTITGAILTGCPGQNATVEEKRTTPATQPASHNPPGAATATRAAP